MDPQANPQRPTSRSQFTDVRVISSDPKAFINIYRAKRLGKWFTLKALKPEFASNIEMQKLFNREFAQGYNLNHPVAATYHAFEEVPGLGRCIVMEDIEGASSLDDAIENSELNIVQVTTIARSLASYLDYVHSLRAVHKTLRPTDIILSNPGLEPKIIDFGFNEAASQLINRRSSGPRRYLSPELINDESGLDETTDTWTLGKIVDEMNQSLDHPSRHLDAIAKKATSPDPADRYYNYDKIDWTPTSGGGRGPVWLLVIIGLLAGVIGAFIGRWTAGIGASDSDEPIQEAIQVVHDTIVVEGATIAPVDTAKVRFMSQIDNIVGRVTTEEWERMINRMEDYADSNEAVDASVTSDYERAVNARVERRLDQLIDDNIHSGDADYRLVRLGVMSIAREHLSSLKQDTNYSARLKKAIDRVKTK